VTEAEARDRIAADYPDAVIAAGGPGINVNVPSSQWSAFAHFVKNGLGCHFFSFLSAVDWKDDGLEVIAFVENADAHVSVLLKTKLGAGQRACPSLVFLYRGANWMERECFDMFGVVFDGHPDLRRMLLPDDWEGHPLLKSYAVDTPHPPYR
jgi:NADH-quinone oxidoreductase subunit C